MYRLLFGTPLAKETMQEAVETRNLETVKDTIRKLKPDSSQEDFNMKQFIYLGTAVKNGDIDIVKLLIEKGLVDNKRDDSILPYLAIEAGNLEMLKLLVDNGWSVNGNYWCPWFKQPFLNANYGHYSLIAASKINNTELVDYTFEQVAKNRKWDYTFTRLLQRHDILPRNIVLKVLKEYPDKVYYDINNYKMLFLDAVKHSDTEIVKEFIKLGYDTKQNCREAALVAEHNYAFEIYGMVTADSGEPDILDRLYHYIWSFFN